MDGYETARFFLAQKHSGYDPALFGLLACLDEG
jgi:hypothetical protein